MPPGLRRGLTFRTLWRVAGVYSGVGLPYLAFAIFDPQCFCVATVLVVVFLAIPTVIAVVWSVCGPIFRMWRRYPKFVQARRAASREARRRWL